MWWNWSAGRFFQRSVIYRLGEAVFNGELNFQSRFCESPKRCRSLSDEFLMRLRMRRNLVVLTCLYLILYPSFVSPLAAAFCNSIRKDFTLIYWSVSAYVRLCARVCDELYSFPYFDENLLPCERKNICVNFHVGVQWKPKRKDCCFSFAFSPHPSSI